MSIQTFTVIKTLQSADGNPMNQRRLEARVEDLNAYGREGFVLLSTLMLPDVDGVMIVDTMGRAE